MDLEAIGIPSRHTSSSDSKLVFTTRSESICVATEVNKKFKVHGLGPEQAWELFQQKVGYDVVNSDSEILELAQKVAKECCGLPLALITIGSAMASKKTPQEWRHSITMLKRYTSEFPGMEDNVFSILKLSYDSLVDDTARNCFLYCSLYPEDHHINVESIIHLWINEGFLDRFEDLNDAIDKGHEVIGSLKAVCLLEIGANEELTVKMHDVLRDLALWIARECGKKENKYLVEADFGMQPPSFKRWKDAERISLCRSSMNVLDGVTPECPHLLTFLLGEPKILSISDDFFPCMPNLRVLDLSWTTIRDLPRSIGCLLQLRYLDLSNSDIEKVPDELGDLGKLQFLDLNESHVLEVPSGLVSRLSRLQVLRLDRERLDNVLMAEELESLDQLRELVGTIERFPFLISKRLRSCIVALNMVGCEGLTELGLFSLFRETGKLRELVISDSKELEKITINCLEADKDYMGSLMTMKTFKLWSLSNLNSVIWDETATHIHFKHLTSVEIKKCKRLKDISWLVLAPILRVLNVTDCMELEDIILANVAIQNQKVFSQLLRLKLEKLPKLKCIVGAALATPCFTGVVVIECPLLKKIPYTSNGEYGKYSIPRGRIDGDAEMVE